MVACTDYEYQLAEYVRKIAEAAIRWQLDEWGFGQDASGGRVGDGEPGGVVWPPITDGPTGDITYEGESINPGRDVYQPWFRSIERHFACFKDLPDPKGFEAGVVALDKARSMLSLDGAIENQNGRPVYVAGNSVLAGRLGSVATLLAGKTSDMVLRYAETYGPAPMAVVFENQRQAVHVASTALTAERDMWAKARQDVLTLADDALKSFQARGGHSAITPWECVKAVAKIATDFLPKAASEVVAKAMNIAETAEEILGKVSKNADRAPAEPTLDGGDHLEVEDSLVNAITRLKEKIHFAEDLVHDMSRQMAQAMRATDPSPFHIHGSAGLSKEFTNEVAEVRINVDDLQRLGTTFVPDVVWEVTKAADIMMDAAGDGPWARGDWSVGDGGRARGAFNDLLELTFTFVTSSGAEIIEAGSILAEHAGAIGNVDQQIGEQLDRTAQEVDEGRPSGDMSPHLAPQPGVSADQQYSDDTPVHGRLASRLGG